MTSAGFPHANQAAVKQLTLLLINISTLGSYIVQLAVNTYLFSAHLGLFFFCASGRSSHIGIALQHVGILLIFLSSVSQYSRLPETLG